MIIILQHLLIEDVRLDRYAILNQLYDDKSVIGIIRLNDS